MFQGDAGIRTRFFGKKPFKNRNKHLQYIGGDTTSLLNEAKKDMLRANKIMIKPVRLFAGQSHHLASTVCEAVKHVQFLKRIPHGSVWGLVGPHSPVSIPTLCDHIPDTLVSHSVPGLRSLLKEDDSDFQSVPVLEIPESPALIIETWDIITEEFTKRSRRRESFSRRIAQNTPQEICPFPITIFSIERFPDKAL